MTVVKSYRRSNDGNPLEVEPSTAGASGGGDLELDLIEAAMSFAFFAAMFATLSETWPVFAAFAQSMGMTSEFSRDMAYELLDTLAIGLNSPAEIRRANVKSAQN